MVGCADHNKSPGVQPENLTGQSMFMPKTMQFDGQRKSVLQASRLRIAVVLSMFVVGFFVLSARAVEVAVVSPAGKTVAAQSVNVEYPRRADILDRNGNLLATTLTTYSLYADPSQVWDVQEVKEDLMRVLPDLDRTELDRRLTAKSRFQWIRRNLTPRQKQAVFELGQPGLGFKTEERRIYPRGPLAAHALGYASIDNRGLAGAELAFNDDILAMGKRGRPVNLSIDIRAQMAMDEELRKAMVTYQAKAGIGVITNIQTGEVISLVSLPDFDPNTPPAIDADGMLNRAARGVYEMGSTFKIFTVAMGLEEGIVSLEDGYDATQPLRIGNRVIRDYHAENRYLTLEEIFTHSSNIGSARLALDAGPDMLEQFLMSLGLFDKAPIELVESARPLLPKKWNESTAASVSFGHAMSVSPLALSAAIGALMNDGMYVPLTLEKHSNQTKVKTKRVVSVDTSRALQHLMRANVVNGSGTKSDVPGYRVGGKTGSAEKSTASGYDRDRLLSSFAAVYPTDAPKYLVLVMLDEPQATKDTFGYATGGWTAAPVAGRVIARTASFLGVEHRRAPEHGAPDQQHVAWHTPALTGEQ